MKYAVLFLTLGGCLLLWAFKLGVMGLWVLWCGISFAVMGAAYAGLGAKILGKQPDGTMSKTTTLLLFPYLVIIWGIWHLRRLVFPEDCYNEIVPGIWLGRRPLAHELPDNVDLIVDLTAEYYELKAVISDRAYLCLPTLDASVPNDDVFRELIEKICNFSGNVYIHCALGHGRAATVTAAFLIAKGFAENSRQAEAMLKQCRPGVSLNQTQLSLLEKFQDALNR